MATNVFPAVTVTTDKVGIWPVLPTSRIADAAAFDRSNTNRFEGFAANGDYVHIPSSLADTLQYYNAAGALQWSKTIADFAALADDWVGMFFDDNLIYVVVVDEGTSTYYTCSVNSAGTIVNIGNDIPSPDMPFPSNTWWFTRFTQTDGATVVQREAIGSGNILVRMIGTNNAYEMTIDISNGTITSDPAQVTTMGEARMGWRTLGGMLIGIGMSTTITMFHPTKGVATLDTSNFAYQLAGVAIINDYARTIQWKNNVELYLANGNYLRTSWDAQEFSDWFDALFDMARG